MISLLARHDTPADLRMPPDGLALVLFGQFNTQPSTEFPSQLLGRSRVVEEEAPGGTYREGAASWLAEAAAGTTGYGPPPPEEAP